MKTLSRVALVAILAFGLTASMSFAQDKTAELAMPKSMEGFINWHLDHDEFGTWEESGVTKDLWVGIPAGLKYTSTSRMTLSQDGKRILYSYHMGTEDGRVISTGTGFSCWDDNAKAPVSSSSGFDMGKPYHGTAKLIGMNNNTIVWEYTEHSQGKTNTYRDTLTLINSNQRKTTVEHVDGKGEGWTSEETRVNPLKAHGLDAMVGSWEMSFPDGATMRTNTNWTSNQMNLISRTTVMNAAGERTDNNMSIIFWNPSIEQIETIHFGGNGSVIPGQFISITHDGDSVTTVTAYEGTNPSGMGVGALATQVISGDNMTTTFSKTMIDGRDHAFSWANTPMKSKRVERSRTRSGGSRTR